MIAAIVALVLLALFGAPLFAVIGAAAMLGFHHSGIDLAVVAIEFFRLAEMPVLLALPFFALAGYLLSESNAPERLVRLTRAWLGWLPGGLAIVALFASALFTAFTGASGVTIIALGALLFPALIRDGYPERFSLGLVTTSGSLGLLFAPALPLILYAIIVQQFRTGPGVRVEDMFLAGLLPGLLMLVLLVAFSHHVGRALPRQPFEWKKALATLREAAWEAPLPVVVLGSVYGGLVAVSEAAALTVLYVLVVEVLVLREIRIRDLPRVMGEAMTLVGAVLVILGLSLASTNYLIDAGVPERLFEAVQALVTDRLTFLLLLNGFLLVLGTMLDIFSALVLVVPLLLPVALGYGIDPVHLGIIFLANLQIGYLTPPIGINLFIASQRFGKPVAEVWSAALPWLLVLLLALAVITYWPALSLFLPGRL